MQTTIRQPQALKNARLARIFFLTSLLFICISIALGGYIFLLPGRRGAGTTVLTVSTNQAALTTTGQYQAQVKEVGTTYMNALLQQHFSAMWSMLHPQIQAEWSGGETAFATYWKNRFQGFTLQAFTTGSVVDLSYWVNPETMQRYNQVEKVQISLQIVAQGHNSSLLVPDRQATNLYKNLPFIVQKAAIGNGAGEGNQWLVLDGGPADLEAPLLPPANPTAKSINVPILMYHYISDIPASDLANPYSYRPGLTVSPTVFNQQMNYFQSRGYHTITFNQFFDALYYDGPLPGKPIIFTFDDGYADAYINAYPILKAHGYSGMFYIITGKVGWDGQATWPQLRMMQENGMQMGSHTTWHHAMGDVWADNPNQSYQELQEPVTTLDKQLGIVEQQFCYPSGDPLNKALTATTAAQQATAALEIAGVISQLKKIGYVGATNDPGVTGTIHSADNPFEITRLRVFGSETIEDFKNEMAPFLDTTSVS